MKNLPQTPNIDFDERGVPFARDFGDTYFSKDGGIDETRAVFLSGCGLPDNWQNKDHFTIAETGFGTGLNFLTTWKVWDEDANNRSNKAAILHFISFELYPLSKEQAAKALGFWPELQTYANTLLENWPIRTFGVQRIWLSETVALSLVIGDINEYLPNMSFCANAWFLDGFAPNRNLDMWSPFVFAQIARLSANDVTIGTYSVASKVQDGLLEAGFTIEKRQGFGKKRERLVAFKALNQIEPKAAKAKTAIIIGGGIAGHAAAYALFRRGIKPIIIDNDKSGQLKASNNPAGLMMPRLDKVVSKQSRFFRASYIYAAHLYSKIGEGYKNQTIIEYPKHERDIQKFAALYKDPPLEPDLLAFENDTLKHFSGGIIYPATLLGALGQSIETKYAQIIRLWRNKDNEWCTEDVNGNIIATAQYCIIANGAGLKSFLELSQRAVYGRAGTICAASTAPQDFTPFGGKSYCVPNNDGVVFGASFIACNLDEKPIPTQNEIDENIENLRQFAPNIANRIDTKNIKSRASIRVVTNDLLPLIGALTNEGEDLFMIGALGSRGFSIAPMAGEIIACLINNEPIPIETDLFAMLDPLRFLKKGI